MINIHKTVNVGAEAYHHLESLVRSGTVSSHGITADLCGEIIQLSGEWKDGSIKINCDDVAAHIEEGAIRFRPSLRVSVAGVPVSVSSLSMLRDGSGIHAEVDRSFLDVRIAK